MVSLPLIIIHKIKSILIRDHLNIFPGALVLVAIFPNIFFTPLRITQNV